MAEELQGILDRINDRIDQVLFLDSHFAALTSSLRLILSPGVIVAETEQEMIYTPLAETGRALLIASLRASKFSLRASASNDNLPIGT